MKKKTSWVKEKKIGCYYSTNINILSLNFWNECYEKFWSEFKEHWKERKRKVWIERKEENEEEVGEY